MAHNFFASNDRTLLCSWCGDIKGVDVERRCPFSPGIFLEIFYHLGHNIVSLL